MRLMRWIVGAMLGVAVWLHTPRHLHHDVWPEMFPDLEIKNANEPRIEPKTEVYEVSAYTPYDETCNGNGITASGTEAIPFHTCACNDLPFGTLVEIDGHIWTVEDRMGRDGCIDLCMSTTDECMQFGRKIMGVTVLE